MFMLFGSSALVCQGQLLSTELPGWPRRFHKRNRAKRTATGTTRVSWSYEFGEGRDHDPECALYVRQGLFRIAVQITVITDTPEALRQHMLIYQPEECFARHSSGFVTVGFAINITKGYLFTVISKNLLSLMTPRYR
jgi:hypothetical protein